MTFVGISLYSEVFLGLKFLISVIRNGFLISYLETKISFLYLIHMIFDGPNTRMIFVLFDD